MEHNNYLSSLVRVIITVSYQIQGAQTEIYDIRLEPRIV